MKVEVIVSTYKNPKALALTLSTLRQQHWSDFGVCIAEDAEDPETAKVIQDASSGAQALKLRHVQQPDLGFRKNRILNAAIRSSAADYLVFVDGDCLLHRRFLSHHCACARPDRYLSGGLIRLSVKVTDALLSNVDFVTNGHIWQKSWLRSAGLWRHVRHRAKLMPETMGPVLDRLSLAPDRWLGSNASAFRSALQKVNGFDETLNYGAEDKELGVRLENAGIKPYSIRYSAPALHLEHARDYADHRKNAHNLALIRAHRASGQYLTKTGLLDLSAGGHDTGHSAGSVR